MRAYRKLRKETSIVEILQLMRVFRSFAKQSMSHEKWKNMRKCDSFKILDQGKDKDKVKEQQLFMREKIAVQNLTDRTLSKN